MRLVKAVVTQAPHTNESKLIPTSDLPTALYFGEADFKPGQFPVHFGGWLYHKGESDMRQTEHPAIRAQFIPGGSTHGITAPEHPTHLCTARES